MPDLGIGEAAAAFGGGDLLAGLFGGGAAADAGAAAAGAADLSSIVGTGAGIAGGTTGLEGTALAAGAGTDLAALTATPGLGVLGTAADAVGLGGAADAAATFGGITALTPTLDAAAGTGPGILGASSTATPTPVGGTTAFGTNQFATTAPSAAFSAPSAVAPAGSSAVGLAAPSGVAAPADATAAGAVSGASGTAPAATPTSSIESLLGKAGQGALDSLTKNPLGIALGAGGLGYSILQGEKQTANQKALAADASNATANSNQLTQSGEALQQYLTSGQLPPQYQQQVDQAISSAKAQAISNAAAQGQSTDPTQNSTLATTLAGIDNQRSAMITNVATSLFSSGTSLVNAGQSAAGLSGQLYQALVQNDTTQAANAGKAIATLAAALNGKNGANVGGVNISTAA